MRNPPSSRSRRFSTVLPAPRGKSATSRARARWQSSATRSRPTTSAHPPRSSHLPAGVPGLMLVDGLMGADVIEPYGSPPSEWGHFGVRRCNHELMVRGTFANVRLKNAVAPGTEGPITKHHPDGAQMTIFEASELYQKTGTPLVIFGGDDYGMGSSRDWAAKGVQLLGVKAVILKSFERIHRANLIGMRVVSLQFKPGTDVKSLSVHR